MTAAAMPLHARLPALAPDSAALQSQVVEALNNRHVDGMTLHAAVVEQGTADTWIEFAAGSDRLHVAPLLADGGVPMLVDAHGRPDAALAAVALGAIEPLVGAVEIVLGRQLRPTALFDSPAPGSKLVRVETHAGNVPVHAVLLAVPVDGALVPVGQLPLDPAKIMEAAPRWTARLAGPTVPVASLGRIAQGDMLLLGTPLGALRFTPPGRDTTFVGRLDVEGGRMVLEDDLGPTSVALPEQDKAIVDAGTVAIPTTVEIDGGGLTLDRLAALAIGSVVALPGAAGGALPVRLVAGGKPIATGELVAVGDGYGMLVNAVGGARGTGA